MDVALGALTVLGKDCRGTLCSLGDRVEERRESSHCCLHKVSVGSL